MSSISDEVVGRCSAILGRESDERNLSSPKKPKDEDTVKQPLSISDRELSPGSDKPGSSTILSYFHMIQILILNCETSYRVTYSTQ